MKPSMYEIIAIVILMGVLSTNINAQGLESFAAEDVEWLCAFDGQALYRSKDNVIRYHEPNEEALKTVEIIAEVFGIDPTFKLLGAKFQPSRSNIGFAGLYKGERIIVYDSDMMFISGPGKISVADAELIAHEMTHHTSGVTNGLGNPRGHISELEADKGAGYALRLLGASIRDVVKTTENLSIEGSESHPPRVIRKQALIKGWEAGDDLIRNLPN